MNIDRGQKGHRRSDREAQELGPHVEFTEDRIHNSQWPALVLRLMIMITSDKSQIAGTWKPISVCQDQATKERASIYDEHLKGLQVAAPQVYWLALVTAESRPVLCILRMWGG